MAGFAKGSNLRAQLAAHNHDGTNSESVTTGTPAAGALAATAGGRAMMATDYFNAATVAAKFATNSFTAAVLLQLIQDGAFAADAATRALFADGIFPLAKLAATAKYQTLVVQQAALTAGADDTGTPILFCPAGVTLTIVNASIVPLGASAGIDDSNKSTWALTDGTNTIVTKEFDADPAFPASGVVADLGALDETHKVLTAGEKLTKVITNGATAATPACLIQITYILADAA